MPPPPLRRQRPPPDERSVSQTSQTNPLGIRVVPYSPPPPDRRPGPASRNTSWRADDALPAADDGPSCAQHRQGSSDLPGPTPSPPSGPSTTARGVAVSDSAAAPQSSATPPGMNPRSYSSSDNGNINAPSQHDGRSASSPSSPDERPWSRRRNIISLSLHSDKTFSLVPHQARSDGTRDSRSPRLSYSTTSVVSDPFTDDPTASSPLTTLPEHDRSFSPICPLTPSPASTPTPTPTPTPTVGPALATADPAPATASPWNYRIAGGLRKVPKTPDLKRAPFVSVASSTPSEQTEDAVPLPAVLAPQSSDSSLRSIHTPSTTSETTNYKVYESTSPYAPTTFFPSSPPDEPNYRILGLSSSPAPSSPPDEPNYVVLGHSSSPAPSDYTGEPPTSPGSSDNYVIHGGSSPASSSPVRAVKRTVCPEYSQESLIVPPLQPRRKPSTERLRPYKPTSRESLRRAASLRSISSILSQEAPQSVLLAAPAAAYLQGGAPAFSILQDKGPRTNHVSSKSATSHMNQHPHQWSSQLSTVASESEGGSEPVSREVSLASYQQRRGSAPLSSHSRNMLSVSSLSDDRSVSLSRSASDSGDQLQAAVRRPSQREVRDLDEHGDGLTDLYALQSRPSRNRLSGLYSIPSADRNLQSSSTSRANSLTSLHVSLPSWAKLYYGSGERRLLTYSSQSTLSEATESRRASFFGGGSPPAEHAPSQIHNKRQRPRGSKRKKDHAAPREDSPDAGVVQDYRPRSFLRRQTSSLWSPHLRQDQRASRYSVWEPPPAALSGEGHLLNRRSAQVALFVIGFIFPLAWMIGACLPLPPNPQSDMEEANGSTSQLDARSSYARRSMLPHELYYEGARWWRRLNRYMSIVGLLVIGAIIALVVIGVRQRWAS